MQEKTEPFNIEAERSVLGSMLIDNETIRFVTDSLGKNDFYVVSHRHIFETIVNVYDKQNGVDLVILKDALIKRSLLEKVGGVKYIMKLEESVPSVSNVVYYAEIVQEKAIIRDLITATLKIQQEAHNNPSDLNELLYLAEREISDIALRRFEKPVSKMHDVLQCTRDYIVHLQEGDSKLAGIPTGFIDLDEITCGLQKGELIIIAAWSGMGKTSLVLNIAEHVGANLKKPMLFFSMEMSAQQISQNMLCSAAKIDAHLMSTGKLSDNDLSKLSLAMENLSASAIFIDDTPGLGFLEIRAKARHLKLQHDIQLIIIDGLRLMEAGRAVDKQQDTSRILSGLKALARELNVPVIAVYQLNHSVETREGYTPGILDLRKSGFIEQDADVVILLHREDYYDPTKKRGEVNLSIVKQKTGPTGQITLKFQQKFLRFESF
ncbi:MAG: replicative DNA helicase [Lentimicrobiaceae bacterium]|nr:replicative DNA helicase [Lentimicrobiaceae bacterium]